MENEKMKKQIAANTKYEAKALDKITARLPIGTARLIQKTGSTVNGFIVTATREKLIDIIGSTEEYERQLSICKEIESEVRKAAEKK